jgi:thiosulfate/3-mercaptopyruvate sulfurtransferase
MMRWTALVDASELAAALGSPGLVVVDCRYVLAGASATAGEEAWARAHLPGAGYAHLDRDLSDHAKPAREGRHPLPEAAAFCCVLERLGISPESQVVAYDAGDGAMAAARFWWLLKLLGHERVAVLDGGFAAWTAQDLPLDTALPTITPGRYRAEFDARRLADVAQVEQALAAGKVLVDARAAERYRGEVEPLDKAAGHIPGARSRPYSMNMKDGRFLPPAQLRAQFVEILGEASPADAILYCGSGVTACHHLLAMEHAGLRGARLFAPSWSGWIDDPAHGIERL